MPPYAIEIPTPIGYMIAQANDSGITSLYFCEGATNASAECNPSDTASRHLDLCNNEIRLYFTGGLREFTTQLSLSATMFQMNVYLALRNIPYGAVSSYGKLAAMLGTPRNARAVGAANARNPVAIIIPCHRLTGHTGKLTGYAGGLWRKSYLLEMERKFLSMST